MRRLAAFALSAVVAACFGVSGPASGQLRSCAARQYSYAGFAASHRSFGVSARITPLASPDVLDGHVAAWVGVGGPGEGPGGTDEWLQVGLSAFPAGGTSTVYYELALPNQPARYTQVRAGIASGESHRVTVLEMLHHPSYWRVWLDNHAVTMPIYLPGSHMRWSPIATAESWNAGASVCNAFAYRFGRVVAAGAAGGKWRTFTRGYRFQDPGYRVVTDSRNTFRALGS
jgi:hypothetical protein